MRISVVVPVYGCKAALPELHARLTNTIEKITSDYEIILVNDNCPQNSWETIEELASSDKHVKGIELSRNFGQMKAILAGLDYSTGDYVVVMDCDLQDNPEEISRLYSKLQEGYDVVFARRKRRKDSRVILFFTKIFYKIYRFATDGNYDESLANYSIVKRSVIDNYCKMREEHRGYVTYIRWLGYKQGFIEVEHNKRFEGKSSYNFKKKLVMAIDLLTSQSDKLLKLFLYLGFLISIIALMFIIFLVIFHFVADVTIGWTSLIATILLMGGINILAIGIVGIYVGNIFIQSKERPLYVIRQILNDDK